MTECAIVESAMIFEPCGVRGVLVKVLRRYRVVLPVNHPTQPGKEALGLVGAVLAIAVCDAVIDAANLPTSVQRIPV